jgi:hypothetical protein
MAHAAMPGQRRCEPPREPGQFPPREQRAAREAPLRCASPHLRACEGDAGEAGVDRPGLAATAASTPGSRHGRSATASCFRTANAGPRRRRRGLGAIVPNRARRPSGAFDVAPAASRARDWRHRSSRDALQCGGDRRSGASRNPSLGACRRTRAASVRFGERQHHLPTREDRAVVAPSQRRSRGCDSAATACRADCPPDCMHAAIVHVPPIAHVRVWAADGRR